MMEEYYNAKQKYPIDNTSFLLSGLNEITSDILLTTNATTATNAQRLERST